MNENNGEESISPEGKISSVVNPENNTSQKGVGIRKSVGSNGKKGNESNTDKNKFDVVGSMVEFLDRFIERKGKIFSHDKKVFDRLDRNLTEENKLRLVSIFLEKDKDLKYCLALCDFLLEGSLESLTRLELLNFIERVLSEYSLFSKIRNNAILQTWLDSASAGADKMGYFEGHFRALSGVDGKGKVTKFSDAQVATLLCISAVWLYFKKESNFFMLIRYLSSSAFNTKGMSNNYIEAQAFGFATSMISSTKKKGFTYFLQMVSDTEKSLSNQLQSKSLESAEKAKEILDLESKVKNVSNEISVLQNEKTVLEGAIDELDNKVSSFQEKSRHRDTHHADSKDELRIRVKNILEGELKDVLLKARKAHSKGKHDVVEYQLNDALEVLDRELNKVSEND